RADVRGVCVCALLAAALPACQTTPERQCNTLAIPVTHIYDPYLRRDTVPVIDVRLCESLAAHAQGVTFPVSTESTQRQFNILVLSGGGAYGAYSAGVLAGWTESGTRPNFDVVTGVSTGALVATLAFLGPERDPLLKRFYTTVTDKDVYARKSEL